MKSEKKTNSNQATLPSRRVHITRYDAEVADDICLDLHDKNVHSQLPKLESDRNIWLHFIGIQDAALLREMLSSYHIHDLVQEDILNSRQRPKIESYGHYVLITTRALYYDKQKLIAEPVYLIVGKNFVFSFQNRPNGMFSTIRNKLLHHMGLLPSKACDFLAYSLLDAIVDDYFVTIDTFAKKVEQLDQALFMGNEKNAEEETVLSRIHSLKHDTIRLRRTVMPTREIISQLVRGDYDLFQEETRIYLRDVYDHTLQVMEVLDAAREMTLSMMDVYLSYQSNQLNKQMRILTVITIIFMPLTLISSIYGMNFTNMPELEWRYGYYAVLAIMVIIAIVLLRIFSKRHWL